MKPDPMHTLGANADQLLAGCRDLGKLAARHILFGESMHSDPDPIRSEVRSLIAEADSRTLGVEIISEAEARSVAFENLMFELPELDSGDLARMMNRCRALLAERGDEV